MKKTVITLSVCILLSTFSFSAENLNSRFISQKDMIFDSKLKLYWQNDKTKAVAKTFEKAKSYCLNLNIGGFTDWRVPRVKELLSIVDVSRYRQPVNKLFVNFENDDYWTLTPYIVFKDSYWIVNFDDGRKEFSTNNSKFIRCVRGEKIARLSAKCQRDDKKQIVACSNSLIWQDNKEALDIKKSFEEAKRYCSSLNLAGFSDWVLPNFHELDSITDEKEFAPSIKRGFKYVSKNLYWTSNSHADFPSTAWNISFNNGSISPSPESLKYSVRCVRYF